MKLFKIIIAGGGTGGHIFPGIALADKFMSINPNIKIMFVGSKRPLERKIFKNTQYHHQSISAMGIRNNGSRLRAILQIIPSILEAKSILKKFRPQLVISVGGYSAGPVGIVAKIKKIPIVVCEQNILPGKTNRLLFKLADRIYTSFKNTKGLENNHKTKFFGNPLRKDILEVNKSVHKKIKNHGLLSKFTILILGGSQGAHAINTAVMDSIKYIKASKKLRFIHQSGIECEERIKEKYLLENVDAEVKNFFDDINVCYKKADIIICRAGATTLAELTAIGRCSILIPYPFASGNHQLLNAESLVRVGGAIMILQEKLNGFNLAQHINNFIDNPQTVTKIASKAKTMGMNKAAELITNDIYKILERKKCI